MAKNYIEHTPNRSTVCHLCRQARKHTSFEAQEITEHNSAAASTEPLQLLEHYFTQDPPSRVLYCDIQPCILCSHTNPALLFYLEFQYQLSFRHIKFLFISLSSDGFQSILKLLMLLNTLISDLIPPSEVDGSSTYESVVGKGTLIRCRLINLGMANGPLTKYASCRILFLSHLISVQISFAKLKKVQAHRKVYTTTKSRKSSLHISQFL